MKNYLSDKRHRSKINDSYSLFLDLLVGVLQGYILSPILFNVYIWDFFFFIEEEAATSYADVTTSSANGTNVLTV